MEDLPFFRTSGFRDQSVNHQLQMGRYVCGDNTPCELSLIWILECVLKKAGSNVTCLRERNENLYELP